MSSETDGPRVTQHDVVEWVKARRWFYAREDADGEEEHVASDIPHHAADLIHRLRAEVAELKRTKGEA